MVQVQYIDSTDKVLIYKLNMRTHLHDTRYLNVGCSGIHPSQPASDLATAGPTSCHFICILVYDSCEFNCPPLRQDAQGLLLQSVSGFGG